MEKTIFAILFPGGKVLPPLINHVHTSNESGTYEDMLLNKLLGFELFLFLTTIFLLIFIFILGKALDKVMGTEDIDYDDEYRKNLK